MDAYKRTALYLHGLNDVDKGWMLSNLTGIHSEKLKELLNDLKRLDIPTDRSLLTNIENMEFNSSIINDEDDHLDMAINIIDEASAYEIVDCLEHEPLELTAILLAVRDWSWKSSFLNLITSDDYNTLVELERVSDERINNNVTNLILRKMSQKMHGKEIHKNSNESKEYLPLNNSELQQYDETERI